MWELIVGN